MLWLFGRGQTADIGALRPPVERGLKLAGQFEFLGTADKGDPNFDLPPPRGVVKEYHLGFDVDMKKTDGGTPTSCGFYRCSRWNFGSFKRASANWNSHTSWGKYKTVGDYPVARTIVVPYSERATALAGRL